MEKKVLASCVSLTLALSMTPATALATETQDADPVAGVQEAETTDSSADARGGVQSVASDTQEATDPVQAENKLSGTCGAEDNVESLKWTLQVNDDALYRTETNGTIAFSSTGDAGNKVDAYTLTISGTGKMADYTSTTTPWGMALAKALGENGTSVDMVKDAVPRITTLSIENGVTGIGDYSFSRMTGLTSLEIPGSVKEIGAFAFWSCTSLNTITLNEGLEKIGGSAFRTIYGMEEKTLNIPASVTTIEPYAFEIFICKGYSVSEDSKSFKAVDGVLFSADGKTLVRYPTKKNAETYQIPEGTEVIGESAFELAPFSSIEFPSTVRTLETGAFVQCTGLKEVTLPDSITTVGDSAFALCESLEKITVGSGVKTIGRSAFSTAFSGKGSRVVVDMTRANGIESIGIGAFYHGTTQVSHSAVYVANKATIDMFGYGSTSENGQLYHAGTYIMCTNGGTVDTSKIDASNSQYFLTPSKEGFEFDGWYDSPDFEGSAYTERQSSGPTQSKYYARWSSTVTFDANGGSGTMEAQKITDATAKLTANAFTREGYDFAGWNTKADGTGIAYVNGATRAGENGNVVLYAQWTKKIGTICTVNAIVDQVYTGEAIEPAVVVKDADGNTLEADKYTVTYSGDLVNATKGDANVPTVTVTLNDGDKATASVSFKIVQDQNPIVAMDSVSVTYGEQYDVNAHATTHAGVEITDGAIAIRYYTDESCTKGESEMAPSDAGTYYAKATLAGTSNYAEASTVAKVDIMKAAASKLAITPSVTSLNGGGTVELEVKGAPKGSDVTLTQTDDKGSAAKTLTLTDGKCTVTLPNATAKYTFTAASTETKNYKAGEATCTVDVSHWSSGLVSNTVTAPSAVENGTVEVGSKDAFAGDTVTIVAKPDEGYVLDKLTVTDAAGNAIELTDKGDGTFTFTMPSSKVTVEASFKPAAVDPEPEPQPENPFTDVAEGDYFADAVAWAVANGVTTGVSPTEFAPYAPCTRAQMLTFLWRASGSPAVEAEVGFTDVPADAYYADAVRWAVANGVTTGVSPTEFAPDEDCLRGQAVTFLFRAQQ